LQERRLPIPAYAAPARATDYTGLPPTISFVGGLEPFRDETVEYVNRVKEAGVPVEFRVFEGCYHAFEVVAPNAAVSREAWDFLYDAFNRYLNLYFE
jgi:acetyl esterase/lipase